jgi:hypothetical protein
MSPSLLLLEIVGVHPVVPTEQEFREAIAIQWGENLSDERLCRAESQIREHFANLYLLEIKIEPADADINWSAITQPIEDRPQANWQVPYDERRLDGREDHWIFFFHFLDRGRLLQTQLGDRRWPNPTPVPPNLQGIRYGLPG